MTQRQKKGYALKRERGQVPHHYNPTSQEFQRGAHRWWPARERGETPEQYGKRLAQMAMRETPSRNGYVRGHHFV